MNKQQVVFALCLVFTQIHTIQKRPFRTVEKTYDQEARQIQLQLSRANLTQTERTNLLNKLKNYFLAEEKPAPVLNNTKIEVLYGSIIKSYQKLLGNNRIRNRSSEPLATKFQEQIIGKIFLHR